MYYFGSEFTHGKRTTLEIRYVRVLLDWENFSLKNLRIGSSEFKFMLYFFQAGKYFQSLKMTFKLYATSTGMLLCMRSIRLPISVLE